MNKIKKFTKQPIEKKILFFKSFSIMILIRISLYFFSFINLQKFLVRFSKPKQIKGDISSIEDIIWAVNVASYYVPKSSCLTNALTAHHLLSRCEYKSNLKIGVFKSEEFEAHAWIEIDNKIVLGETEKDFVPLVSI